MVDLPRRPIASRERGWARALAGMLVAANVPPNAISVFGLLFAIAAGLALLSTGSSTGYVRTLEFLASAALIQLRLLCNMLDGMVAVAAGRQTRGGELFNDMPDRFADAAVLLGAGYSLTAMRWGAELGWLATVSAILTAYVRLLGGSMGLRQYFGGPMAKPQRMAVMTVASLLSTLEPLAGLRGQVVAIALTVIIAGSALTIVVRTARIVRGSAPR